MSSTDRQELIRNAVAFLSDPNTQASSASQRIQFLEAKGLTPPEIDLALRQASDTASSSQQAAFGSQYGASPYFQASPLRLRWDWRDYFITAVVSGAVTYGAVGLFKKYLLPHLQPPSATAYEEDRDALTAQFDAAEALLKEIQGETVAMRTAVDDQKEKIEKTTRDVQDVVTEIRVSEIKTRDELREIREEMNTIREMIPKMIEKNKESQTQSLGELQQELKSLKALLLTRPHGTSPSPMSLPRPVIPSWQLANPTPVASGQSTSDMSVAAPAPVGNGKGKEVIFTSDASSQ